MKTDEQKINYLISILQKQFKIKESQIDDSLIDEFEKLEKLLLKKSEKYQESIKNTNQENIYLEIIKKNLDLKLKYDQVNEINIHSDKSKDFIKLIFKETEELNLLMEQGEKQYFTQIEFE